MKSILVPTDFSDCAKYASDVAMQLARRSQATLHFVHLMDVPIDWLYSGVGMDERYPDVNKRVKKARRQLDLLSEAAEKQGIKVKTDIEYNHAYSILIKYTQQHAIDLLVMGSHGASGLKELFIGSNTQKIVRASAVPVLVIKRPPDQLNIRHVVVAYDFETEAYQPFKKITELIALFQAKIHLVFINTPANFMETREISHKMEAYAAIAPQLISSTDIYNSLSFEKGLLYYCREKEGTMIILMTHVRKGLNRLLNSSVTERIINHVDIPVMSLNIQQQEG
jgi:nucleotide-binding universal stress UspA family protein